MRKIKKLILRQFENTYKVNCSQTKKIKFNKYSNGNSNNKTT